MLMKMMKKMLKDKPDSDFTPEDRALLDAVETALILQTADLSNLWCGQSERLNPDRFPDHRLSGVRSPYHSRALRKPMAPLPYFLRTSSMVISHFFSLIPVGGITAEKTELFLIRLGSQADGGDR